MCIRALDLGLGESHFLGSKVGELGNEGGLSVVEASTVQGKVDAFPMHWPLEGNSDVFLLESFLTQDMLSYLTT